MKSYEALEVLSDKVGNKSQLSKAIGEDPSHFYIIIMKKCDSRCSTLAKAAAVAGLKLCICKKPPKDAIIIDADDE